VSFLETCPKFVMVVEEADQDAARDLCVPQPAGRPMRSLRRVVCDGV
jgi:hypothetical protein